MADRNGYGDLKVVVSDVSKRKSGEAFHIILESRPGQQGDGVVDFNVKHTTPKKELSLEEIKVKMDQAEERRLANIKTKIAGVKAEEEKLAKAQLKKSQANEQFAAMAEKNLKEKMSQYELNHSQVINSKIDKFRAMNLSTVKTVQKNKKAKDDLISQVNNTIQEKLSKSEQLRQEQMKLKRDKLKVQEERALQVRKKKSEEKLDSK